MSKKIKPIVVLTDESANTAIPRTKLPKPVSVLKDHDMLTGRILDYGCGRVAESMDSNDGIVKTTLEPLGFKVFQYDKNYYPDMPSGKFDTILCIYVLNVVAEDERKEIMLSMKNCLKADGHIYIAVRDEKSLAATSEKANWQSTEDGSGYVTGSGTKQYPITHDSISKLISELGMRSQLFENIYVLDKHGREC